MRYKIMLFDADGVLIKSSRLFSDKLSERHGISLAKMTPFFTGVFKECSKGRADLKVELEKVIGDWGWTGTVDELLEFWFTAGIEIEEDVLALAGSLREQGVRCFVATDNERYRGEHLRKRLVEGGPFENVFFSAEIGAVKKEPAFFAYVLQHVGAKPDEILFVDDDEQNVEVAKLSGINGHFYTSLDDLKKLLAD